MPRNTKSLWVFGYGSLLWAPGFEFTDSVDGCVKGYARRFWQGNVTHRGTPSKPGRVATLVEDSRMDVWGVAYELVGDEAVAYLNNREVTLGGYVTKFTKFYPTENSEPFSVLLYLANSESRHWLGEASEETIAEEMVTSFGNSGHNVEYILRIADYVRKNAPEVKDSHLFSIESHVRRKIIEKKLDLSVLMGPDRPKATPTSVVREEEPILSPPLDLSDFMSTTKLRCLSI